MHKARSLVKPMVVTSTTGYIISIIGPFFANSSNNHASIWEDCSTKNREGVLAWLKENDVIIVDRGFFEIALEQ